MAFVERDVRFSSARDKSFLVLFKKELLASFLQGRVMKTQEPGFWATRPPQQTTRIAVMVTFLRQEQQPALAPVDLPPHTGIVRVHKPTVGFYRYLYDTVGGQYVWWLRRTMPQAQLAALITAPGVSLHVMYQGNEPAGFFELDARAVNTVNLSYFGLLPHAIGNGLGTALLRAGTMGW